MSLTLKLLAILPRKSLSHLVGQVVHAKRPRWFATWLKHRLIKDLKIQIDEAEQDVSEYPSFGAFFARRLKPGLRPISFEGLASPCDGKLQTHETIHKGTLMQSKGITYALDDLLGQKNSSEKYEGGVAITIYLAPHNYHRVHVPERVNLMRSKRIAGDLWPVNRASVEKVHPLFCLNERWVLDANVKGKGEMCIVMVGATNVGNMELFHLNEAQHKDLNCNVDHGDGIELNRGDELGVFHMGSTVILILDRNLADHYKMSLSSRLLLCGENLSS